MKKIKNILNKEELRIVRGLPTPHKIQDFLDTLPFNFERGGETYYSPRVLLHKRLAHCFEGALFAHLCLAYHGYKSFLVDLKVKKSARADSDHTLCIFEQNGFWGALSKTNHSIIRWRDPIYKTQRELVMSYFHEYFVDSGEKTLESFSKPFDAFANFGVEWVASEEDLDTIAEAIDKSRHINFVPKVNKKKVRRAGKTEIKGAAVLEWRKNNSRI